MSAHKEWWKRGVIYQIYPRSFQDTNQDGVGDLQGIIERLDYLNDGTENSLGIDAIWISPFYPSPMADFGYDVSDYKNIDPLFGDLETFDRLVAEAHKRNIKIIIDYVPNHTSDQHPWFIESRASTDNAKRDWYIWRDPKADGSEPNNWGSFFGGPAWTYDKETEQYYMHQFVPEQPELNWRNPEVKEAMLDVLRFWFDRDVDGFRMDVVFLIIKDEALRDNPPNPDASPDLPANDIFSRLFTVYNLDQEEAHPIMREFRQLADSYDDKVLIGELWGELDRWVRYYGETGDELHLPFNFRLLFASWNAQMMRQLVDDLEAVLPDFAWPNYVLGNHDQPRLASRYGGQEQARVAAMMLLTLRGTPTLYYGDELGMPNTSIAPDQVVDPQGVNLGVERTRDVARTPMQWTSELNAGFAEAEPWLPLGVDYASRNVVVQEKDETSIFHLYRRLLWTRKKSLALQIGRYMPLDAPDDCFIYIREHESERYLVALNFSTDATEHIVASEWGQQGEVVLATGLNRHGVIDLSEIVLRPLEGLLLKLSPL